MPPPAQPRRANLVAALCDKYALGHPEIDTQHRRIFEIIAHADEGKPTAEILTELYAYAGDHFAAEERIAEEHNVDDIVHVAAHHALLDQILVYQRNPSQKAAQIRKFLVTWITTHIDQEDRDLVRAILVGERLQERMDHNR